MVTKTLVQSLVNNMVGGESLLVKFQQFCDAGVLIVGETYYSKKKKERKKDCG